MSARITQSAVESITLLNGAGRITQSVVETVVGLGISCDSPPAGVVGVAYSHTFPAGSGQTPYVFTISAGALPPGLVLNGSTGIVSGAPLTPGTYNFTITVTDALTTQASAACSITVTGPATPPGGNTPIVGGQPYQEHSRGGCSGFNLWDLCMLKEMQRWRHLQIEDLCAIPKEYRNLLPWDDTFGAIPPGAVPFHAVGSITTPTTASGDNVVVFERVPTGYNGILTGYFVNYTGNGFVQGSGDIVTRLRINQRYVKDLGNNLFLMGTPQLPLPMTEGQFLLSGMTTRVLVTVPNLSGLIQIGSSRIYAGIIGFYWPRG